jgi:hypothetical protein
MRTEPEMSPTKPPIIYTEYDFLNMISAESAVRHGEAASKPNSSREPRIAQGRKTKIAQGRTKGRRTKMAFRKIKIAGPQNQDRAGPHAGTLANIQNIYEDRNHSYHSIIAALLLLFGISLLIFTGIDSPAPSSSVAWKSLDKQQDLGHGFQPPSLQAAQDVARALRREWHIPFVQSWKMSSVCALKAMGMGVSLATVMAIPGLALIVLL